MSVVSIAFLAKEGFLSEDSEEKQAFEEDVEGLLSSKEELFEIALLRKSYSGLPIIDSALSDFDIMHCGKISSAWKKTKNFVKKHKKEVIIGAVVVVAVVAVVVVSAATGGTGAAPVAQAGAAAVGAVASSSDTPEQPYHEDPSTSIGLAKIGRAHV